MPSLALNFFYNNTLLLIFHIWRNKIVDLSYNEFFLFVILRRINAVESMYVALNVTYLSNITVLNKLVDCIRHSSHKQINLKLLQHIIVQGIAKSLSFFKTFFYPFYCCLSTTHSNEKLFKIKRIHLFYSDASNRHGWCLSQSHSKFRTTCNVTIAFVLI